MDIEGVAVVPQHQTIQIACILRPLVWQPEGDTTDFSPDGKFIVSQGGSGSVTECAVRIWDSGEGKQLASFDGMERILCMASSPSGRILAVAELVRDNLPGATCVLHLLEVPSGQRIRKFKVPQGSVWSLAFTPDGRTLASGGGDSTILLWDMTASAAKVRPAPLEAAELDRLWADLAGDAPKAATALARLVLDPERSVPFVRDRLRPTAAPAERVGRLIADLDSERFAKRQHAVRALEELGEGAEAMLRKTLEGNVPLEVRQRLEKILRRLDRAALRPLRTIDALEEIGTGEARRVLEGLAKAAANPRVAHGAAAALLRLKNSRSP